MIALLALIPAWFRTVVISIAAALIGFAAGEQVGARTATAEAEARSAQATINAMKERGLINEAVRNMDDCSLLAEFGVMCDDRQP